MNNQLVAFKTKAEIDYENYTKLQFIKKLRKHLSELVEGLKDSEMGFDERDCVVASFFFPFADGMHEWVDSHFWHPEHKDSDFEIQHLLTLDWMEEKYFDLTKFLMQVFKPTYKLFKDAVTSENYDDLLRKFEKKIATPWEKQLTTTRSREKHLSIVK